ncbi:hypothetical protein BHYA_0138g00190 [Botrytis hyacinthi]|uniref:Cytochrome P450 n=1 Tax=Botrytis hyacinthi TaxID=278943 RepID=A0A4Z1GGJ2_9HELO|nr:hypothetical protein BHYA_0138g00190 [Botrytis hyacinthi]
MDATCRYYRASLPETQYYSFVPLIRFGRRAWEFKDKAQIHLEIGDICIMVTPDKNVLYICDADTLSEVLLRRNEFKRPREVLGVLSTSLDQSVSGEDWRRHKKATGPPFSNEQTNNLVWQEALRQIQEMMHYWIDQGELALQTTAEDAKTFSLNILPSTGFGKSYPFNPPSDTDNDSGHSMSYKESLSLIVGNAIPILIIGPNFLLKWKRHLLESSQKIAQATVEFQTYMKEMVQEERELIAKGKRSKPNLMTSLIRASQSNSEFKTNDTDTRSEQSGLSESEIFGNVFVFNFAGHDTISHTLCYALNLLAAHPTLETLRLYHPLVTFTKSTGNLPRTITYGSKELHLPPNTMIMPSILDIQSHPHYRGADRLLWRPSRWIISSSNRNGELTKELWTPPKGSYMPWSEGPRGCPGKKFGQVEFVAAMAGLFHGHRVEIVKEGGENQREAEKRVKGLVDHSVMVLLLQMMNPEKAGLRWVRKG